MLNQIRPLKLQSHEAAMHENILFADLDLPAFPSLSALSFIKSASPEHWLQDSYRNSNVLPIMTNSGLATLSAMQSQTDNSDAYKWTQWAHPEMIEYFEEYFWPWLGRRTRVTILRTAPNQKNHEHIDCSPTEIGTIQLKLRIVLQGKSDSLYFIDDSGTHIPVARTSHPFLMDGSWPHGMENLGNEEKYTLCLGAPWRKSDKYPLFHSMLRKSDFSFPKDITPYLRK